jgi:uncharacterized protein DUF4390
MVTGRAASLRATLLTAVILSVLAGAAPARADLRIGNLDVFLNDFDVTVHVVLFGAVPESLQESLQSGIPVHVRLRVELWQYNRFVPDRRTQSRNVDRQIAYNPLTKEYKVVSLKSEHREPYLTKDLREAQRVISEFRIGNLIPAAQLSPKELYYVRAQSIVTLGGVNSWFARFTGDAEQTDWVRSNLLTLTRSQ